MPAFHASVKMADYDVREVVRMHQTQTFVHLKTHSAGAQSLVTVVFHESSRCEMHQSQTFVHHTNDVLGRSAKSRGRLFSTKEFRCEMHQTQTFVHLIRLSPCTPLK
jgi:hypothetical protein